MKENASVPPRDALSIVILWEDGYHFKLCLESISCFLRQTPTAAESLSASCQSKQGTMRGHSFPSEGGKRGTHVEAPFPKKVTLGLFHVLRSDSLYSLLQGFSQTKVNPPIAHLRSTVQLQRIIKMSLFN